MATENLQDRYLQALRDDRTCCTLFLMNGFQIRCCILAFDPFCVMVNADGKQELIYKHAISTIIPSDAVKL